ncbi:MAG: hypothetical protein DRO00_04815 [Thermoproteota archaeon]|nr:MAG: hypothetical protein DRO00_04815 [Candidatus Korarchaeota archaeon]
MQKMTSKERMLVAINLGEPDIMPVAPYIGSWYAPKLCGLQISEYTLGSNKKRAQILLEAQRRYGYDWIMAGSGHPHDWKDNIEIKDAGNFYLVIDRTNGTKKKYPKDDVPHTPFQNLAFEEIEKMEIQDHADILRSGVLEQVEIISRKAGKDVLVVGQTTCPWSKARRLTGLIEWFKALYTSPELPKKAMDYALKANLEYAKALIEAGVEALFIEEGSVGADSIPPEFYEKFAFPYEYAFIKELKKMGVPVILSVTGNIMPILNKLLETNVDALHFEESKKGFEIPIFEIRKRLRGKKCFFAPFDAVNLLRTGSKEAIEKAVKKIIKIGKGGGVVLSTGSPVLKDVPLANFETMIKSARRYAQLDTQHTIGS